MSRDHSNPQPNSIINPSAMIPSAHPSSSQPSQPSRPELSKVEVVVLDDSDADSPPQPSPPKRPRAPPAVIDVDDDEQLQQLERNVALRVPRRTAPNPVSFHVSGAASAGQDKPGKMHFGRGGEVYKVNAAGGVDIVDSDEEKVTEQILGTEEGLAMVRAMRSDFEPEGAGGVGGQQVGMQNDVNLTTGTQGGGSAQGVANGAPAIPEQDTLPPLLDFITGVADFQSNAETKSNGTVQRNGLLHGNSATFPNGAIQSNTLPPLTGDLQPGLQNGVMHTNQMLQPPDLNTVAQSQPIQPYPIAVNQPSAPAYAVAQSDLNGVNPFATQPTQQVRFAPVAGPNMYISRPDFHALPAGSSAHNASGGTSSVGYQPPSHGAARTDSDEKGSDDALSAKELKKILKQNEITADATEECDTPKELKVELMAHQRRALAWMRKREKPMVHEDEDLVVLDEECLGGILADDQGLGKTLSMIALLVSNPPVEEAESRDDTTSNESDDDGLFDDESEGEATREPWGTLIVCPVSLINQWKEELETKLERAHRPSIYLYHGSNRTNKVTKLQRYDVVITTYSVLAHEYPKVQKDHEEYAMRKQEKLSLPTREPGPICKVNWHRVVLDEAQYVKNRSTDAWSAVMSLNSKKRWCLTGTPIQNSVDDLYALFCFIRYNFVPSYEMWNIKWKRKLENNNDSVREKAFNQFQAITGVVLLRRTKLDAISGKPLITLPTRTVHMDERKFADKDEAAIYFAVAERSVLTFNKFLAEGTLNANYSTVLLALLRMRQACNHPFLIQYTQMQNRNGASAEVDDKYDTPYSREDLEEALELVGNGHALTDLVHESAKELLVKVLTPPLKGTPSNTVFLCSRCGVRDIWEHGIILSCSHMFCRTCCRGVRHYKQCLVCPFSIAGVDEFEAFINADHIRREVHAKVVLGKSFDSSTQLSRAELKVLMEERIREHTRGQDSAEQSPELQTNGYDSDTEDSDLLDDDELMKNRRRKRNRTNGRVRQGSKRVRRGRAVLDPAARQHGEKLLTALSQHSTKVLAILEDLEKTRKQNPEEKTLIFSQWTSFLDILEFHIRMRGYGVCRLDGSMQAHHRQKNLKEFRERADKNVFLISLSAGGTGLNLTVSNHVILSDVWWNPAVEEQAIDRVHRIGQTREVHVKRFRMADTVEEKIYKICERKKQMADGTLGAVGKQNYGRTKMSMQELINLFSGAAKDIQRFANADSAAMEAANNILRYSVPG